MFVSNGVPLGDLGRGVSRPVAFRGGRVVGFRPSYARGRGLARSRALLGRGVLARRLTPAHFGYRRGAAWMGFGTRANWLRYMAYLGRTATYGAQEGGGTPGVGGGGGGGSDSGGGGGLPGGNMEAAAGGDSQELQQLEEQIQELQAQMQQQHAAPRAGGAPRAGVGSEHSGFPLIDALDQADAKNKAALGEYRGGRGYRGEFRGGFRGLRDRFRGWLGTEIDHFHPGMEWGGRRWHWDPYRHRFVEV